MVRCSCCGSADRLIVKFYLLCHQNFAVGSSQLLLFGFAIINCSAISHDWWWLLINKTQNFFYRIWSLPIVSIVAENNTGVYQTFHLRVVLFTITRLVFCPYVQPILIAPCFHFRLMPTTTNQSSFASFSQVNQINR